MVYSVNPSLQTCWCFQIQTHLEFAPNFLPGAEKQVVYSGWTFLESDLCFQKQILGEAVEYYMPVVVFLLEMVEYSVLQTSLGLLMMATCSGLLVHTVAADYLKQHSSLMAVTMVYSQFQHSSF